MANYVKIVDYASKDALTPGDPNKVVRGTEIDAEFEAIESAVASKADLTSPAFLGSPTAPTPASNADNTLIATTAFVRDILPAGVILAWSGSVATIPSGWLLCDGTSGTPDLRDRFIVGAGNLYGVGAAGGSKDAVVVSHTHTVNVTDPGHTHPYVDRYHHESSGSLGGASSTAASGGHNGGLGTNGTDSDNDTYLTLNATTSSNTTGIAATAASAGVSGTDANLPPYYAMCWIMKS